MTQANMNVSFDVGPSAEQVEGGWLGIHTDVAGRPAVVAEGMETKAQALEAVSRFIAEGEVESREATYVRRKDPKYPGRYAVYREGRLGSQLVRESSSLVV